MPGKVSIPNLITRREQGQLKLSEQALLSLLRLAGAKLEEFSQAGNHERLIREMENASNAISDEVFDFWSQNKELEVKLEVLAAEPGAPPPLNEGPVLQVRVRTSRRRVTVPFDERSRGFVWFFSFLAYFTELEDTIDGDLILLLDEPGLSLHGRAQEDLLRLIDERLAPKHQVPAGSRSPSAAPGSCPPSPPCSEPTSSTSPWWLTPAPPASAPSTGSATTGSSAARRSSRSANSPAPATPTSKTSSNRTDLADRPRAEAPVRAPRLTGGLAYLARQMLGL